MKNHLSNLAVNMYLTRDFWFSAAHFLPDYRGKCRNMHGHNYRLEVTIEGSVKKNGMVMDFEELKEKVNPVLRRLDHRTLNDIIENPTAENTVIWLWNKLEKKLPLYGLRLWETKKCSVIYRRE